MKFLGRLTVGVVLLVVAAAVTSVLLPGHAHVERRIAIDAPPKAVFPLLNDYRNAAKWSPGLARDPQAKLTFSGPAKGVGAKMSWQSTDSDIGAGSQEITASRPDSLVRIALDFEGRGTATAYFQLIPTGEGTVLVWGFDADLGANPVKRYLGLMFDRWIGPYYEQGLANIKRIAEAGS